MWPLLPGCLPAVQRLHHVLLRRLQVQTEPGPQAIAVMWQAWRCAVPQECRIGLAHSQVACSLCAASLATSVA